MCRDSHDGSSCIDICLIIAKICHIVCRVHIYPYIQSLSKYNVRIIAYSLILSKYILMWRHVGILILMIELINPRLIITHKLKPLFHFRRRTTKIEQVHFLSNLHAICRSCEKKLSLLLTSKCYYIFLWAMWTRIVNLPSHHPHLGCLYFLFSNVSLDSWYVYAISMKNKHTKHVSSVLLWPLLDILILVYSYHHLPRSSFWRHHNTTTCGNNLHPLH